MSLFREDRVQFVPVVFDLIDHPLFHRWSPEGFKLYVWLRRHIWRDPLRAPREIRPFYEQGFLAAYATKELIAKQCMNISSRSLADIFKELRDIGACRTQNTGRGYVFILGEWRRWPSPETGQEVYAEGWYLDLQVDDDPSSSSNDDPSTIAPPDRQNLPVRKAKIAPQKRNEITADGQLMPGREANGAPINKEHNEDCRPNNTGTMTTTTTTKRDEIVLAGQSPRNCEAIGHAEEVMGRMATTRGPNPRTEQVRPQRGAEHGNETRATEEVVLLFEAANGRRATGLEQDLLRQIAADFDAVARDSGEGDTGAAWVMAAIVEAVESGSSYVAPRRIRQICERWRREGFRTERESGARLHDRQLSSSRPRRARGEAGVGLPSLTAEGAVARALVGVGNSELEQDAAVAHGSGATEADQAVWATALRSLTDQISKANFDTWLRGSSLVRREGDTFVIAVRNGFVRDWINIRLRGHLRRALSEVVGASVEVSCVVWAEGEGEFSSR